MSHQANERDQQGNTPLIWASSEGNYQLVELLIDEGAAVNLQNFVGETALSIAAARGFEGICALLIENGGNTNISNLDGASPLHMAAACGHVGIVKLLVSRGAYVNAFDDEGDTPLHYAVREGCRDVVEVMVKNCGADYNAKNEDMESPLDLAVELGESSFIQLCSVGSNTFVNPQFYTAPEYHLFIGEEREMKREEFHQVTDELARLSARSVAIY